MMKQDFLQIRELLGTPKKIVVTTHHMPDGDAMGSALGLYQFLIRKNHSVQVITPTEYPDFLHWLPGNSEVFCFTLDKKRSRAAIEDAEIIFLVDCSALSRIDGMEKPVANSNAVKILIDHHPSPHNFAKYELVDPVASSTAELLYEFIVKLGEDDFINKTIAECIYTGIMTDTGSFAYGSTTVNAHRIAAEMIRRGANHLAIHEKVYCNHTEDRVRFIGYCLQEKLRVLPEYRTSYLCLSQKELKRFNSRKGDTEGLVNYGITIAGVNFSALFVEREDRIKISFRSRGTFSVNDFARRHFSGGGHENAAGGHARQSMDETIQKFIGLLKKYKENLVRGDASIART